MDHETRVMKLMNEIEAGDETLFDFQKLLLLGILFCKGSRVGKSSLVFPLVTR